MQNLLILQSLWSMQRLRGREPELPLETALDMIAAAGFDGVAGLWTNREEARRLAQLAGERNLIVEGLVFPASVDDLKPALDWGAEFGVHHLNIQPNVRPRRVGDCVAIVEGWQRLAEQVDFPVHVETHRDRMTNDLFFTLDLLDACPGLKLTADLSHYVVSREMVLPIADDNRAAITRILDHAWAFHGRIASSEQVQIELSLPHHAQWVEQFRSWWSEGFSSWRPRASRRNADVPV